MRERPCHIVYSQELICGEGSKREEHRKVGFVSQLVLNNPEYLSLFIVSDG